MFQKLRTSRYRKATVRKNSSVVEFTGKVQRIARVHQFGLKDRPNQFSREVVYPERQLLGSTIIDSKSIESLIFDKLYKIGR